MAEEQTLVIFTARSQERSYWQVLACTMLVLHGLAYVVTPVEGLREFVALPSAVAALSLFSAVALYGGKSWSLWFFRCFYILLASLSGLCFGDPRGAIVDTGLGWMFSLGPFSLIFLAPVMLLTSTRKALATGDGEDEEDSNHEISRAQRVSAIASLGCVAATLIALVVIVQNAATPIYCASSAGLLWAAGRDRWFGSKSFRKLVVSLPQAAVWAFVALRAQGLAYFTAAAASGGGWAFIALFGFLIYESTYALVLLLGLLLFIVQTPLKDWRKDAAHVSI